MSCFALMSSNKILNLSIMLTVWCISFSLKCFSLAEGRMYCQFLSLFHQLISNLISTFSHFSSKYLFKNLLRFRQIAIDLTFFSF